MAEEARRAIGSGLGIGPMADISDMIEGAERSRRLPAGGEAAVHVTPYGMCVRHWTISPCARHGACAAGDRQMIVKGDPAQRQEVAGALHENSVLLGRAMAEVEEGQKGADKHAWQYRLAEVTALEATLAVHDDPSIEDGTLYQLDLPAVLARRRRK